MEDAGVVSLESLGRYLNDHLAGSVVGLDLAEQIEADTSPSPLAVEMVALAADIEADKVSLETHRIEAAIDALNS